VTGFIIGWATEGYEVLHVQCLQSFKSYSIIDIKCSYSSQKTLRLYYKD